MKTVFERTKGLTDIPFHYCSGCTHGIAHRLVGEVLFEMGQIDNAVGVAPVGCSVMAYKYFNCDMIQAAHGRAPAVATGAKRANPDSIVFTYQGDGDLAAIGTAETVHAATRGENITVIFINNTIYGMTSGQMAPTTLVDQVTQTTPYGRKASEAGYPLRVSEMLATLDGVAFAERQALNNVKNVMASKRAIKKAFETQIAKKGFSIVELLSICPTYWGMDTLESVKRLEDVVMPYYPIGNLVPGKA